MHWLKCWMDVMVLSLTIYTSFNKLTKPSEPNRNGIIKTYLLDIIIVVGNNGNLILSDNYEPHRNGSDVNLI